MATRPERVEVGMLFSGEFPMKIAMGDKTQTRRPITRRNSYVNGVPWTDTEWLGLRFDDERVFVDAGPSPAGNPGPYLHVPQYADGIAEEHQKDWQPVMRVYPRLWVGDRIWVRESFRVISWQEGEPELIEYRDGTTRIVTPDPDSTKYEDWSARIGRQCIDDCFAAGLQPNEQGNFVITDWKVPTRWRPGMFMPRWCCRSVLEVVEVRAQRIQEITWQDCGEEGVEVLNVEAYPDYSDILTTFAELWDWINGKKYPYAANGWVWVYTFRREAV